MAAGLPGTDFEVGVEVFFEVLLKFWVGVRMTGVEVGV